MTPLGHLSLSYLTGKSNKSLSLSAVVAGGVLPDIDFIFILFDWFNQVHRVVTHNLLFLLLASAAAAFVAADGKKQSAALSLFLGGCTHLLIDSIMDNNSTNGVGVALLWPFSDVFFSPFNLFHARMDAPGWNNPLAMIGTLIPGLMYEIPLYFLSLVLFFRRGPESQKSA